MSQPALNQKLPSFDELVKLVQEDESAFEQLKREKCEEMIRSASSVMRDRLWAQQSHIDRLVGHCKNPNHVNVVLMQELVKQVGKFQDTLYDSESVNINDENVVSLSRGRCKKSK